MSSDDTNATSVAEWFDRYGPMVYRRALTLLGDPADAEDALQEVFVRAATQRDRFRGQSRVSTWLYRITTNYCLNQLRDTSRRAELLAQHPPIPEPGAPDPTEMVTFRRLLQAADPRQAEAAVAVYVDGMTRDEAAEKLGVSLRTVQNLLHRFGTWARSQLDEKPPRATGMMIRIGQDE